jgi:hypothetical protein
MMTIYLIPTWTLKTVQWEIVVFNWQDVSEKCQSIVNLQGAQEKRAAKAKLLEEEVVIQMKKLQYLKTCVSILSQPQSDQAFSGVKMEI